MVGAEVVFLLLVQAQPASPLDSAVAAIPGYRGPEAPIVDDATFLKRVFKDLIDAVPAAAEVQAFVAHGAPDKRSRMVDLLLDDDRFAEFWSKRFSVGYFGDLEKPRVLAILDKPAGIEVRLARRYQEWLRDKLKKDTPWTRIVAETLDARGTTEGDPALGYLLSFHRGEGAAVEFAQGVARDFLGIRLDCVRCHDHPYDRWNMDQFHSMAAFVARQEARGRDGEVVVRYLAEGEVKDARGKVAEPRFLYGGTAEANDDRMKVLGRLLSQKSTTQLPRALANRVWGWLFGAGIVDPVDDFNLRNRPASPAVLNILVKDLIESNYSVKRLVRVICATTSYQRATPDEAPGAMSFRHLKRGANGRLAPLENAPKLEPALQIAGAWIRIRPAVGARASFLVRGKADPSMTAEVWIHPGRKDKELIDRAVRQFFKPKRSSAPLDAGSAVTLEEMSGSCSCVAKDRIPAPWLLWAAAVETPAEAITFRFEGPASVLREWRDEFIALVNSAR